MDEKLQEAVNTLTHRFGTQFDQFRDEISMVVQPSQIVEFCRVLREELEFETLADQTAVDYWPVESPRFHVIYQVYSIKNNIRLCLRVPLDGNAPSLPTIEQIYPNANWFERELWDLFGIRFVGNSDLRRLLMPEDWQGHPLRKDYPLAYEEVMFSFNYDEINGRKPYARE